MSEQEAIFDLYAFLMGGLSAPEQQPLPYEPLQYPTQLPKVSGVRSITFFIDHAIQRSESPFTFQSQTFSSTGDRMRAIIELPKMGKRQAGLWQGFLLNLRGGFNNFLFGDVLNPNPKGEAKGSPRVDGANQTGRRLETKGWTPNVWGQLLAGDKIQIQNRLYWVTRDVNSDEDGNATLDISPSLRVSPPDEILIYTSNAKGIFTLRNPEMTLSSQSISRIYDEVIFEVVEDI